MEKLKPLELKQEAGPSNIVGDFTTYKPSDEQAPGRQYQKQLKECRRQLNECQKQLKERRKQLGEISREEDDLRGTAKRIAEGAWKLRTSLRTFQDKMQKANSIEAQITELTSFNNSLRDGSSVSVISLEDMVKTHEYVKGVLSMLSERKKAQATLNGMLAEQEKLQMSQENLNELMHSAETVSEEARQELEQVSKETVETVEQGERAIEGAREVVENVNKNIVLLRQRLDAHIKGLEDTAQNIIDECDITRDRKSSIIKVGCPEKMLEGDFKKLRIKREKINGQMRIKEEEARVLEEKIRIKEEQKRLDEELKSIKEEQKRLDEEKVHVLEEKVRVLEEKKRVLDEQKRLLIQEEKRLREEQMKKLEDFLQGTKDSTSGETALEENKDSTSGELALGIKFLKKVYGKDPQRALAIFKLGTSVDQLHNTIEQEAKSKESTTSALLGSEAAANISNYTDKYLLSVLSYIRDQNSDKLADIEDYLTRAGQVFQSYLERMR